MTEDEEEYVNVSVAECEHTVHDLETMDSDSYELQDNGKFHMWGECKCGAPVVIWGHVDGAELDTHGVDEDFEYDFLYNT